MKTFKAKRLLIMGVMMIVTALLFICGKGHDAAGVALANTAVISLSDAEKEGFSEHEQKMILACKKLTHQIKEDFARGAISKEEVQALIAGVKNEIKTDDGKTLMEKLAELDTAAKAQGTTLQDLGARIAGNEAGNKSVAEVLQENKEALEKVYKNGSGAATFMIQVNNKGQFVMRPFDPTKAADVHGTIANIGGGGGSASIAQSIDAASLLRLGGDSPIISQYRNTPWVFDLCNMVNAGFEMPIAMWYEEQAKQGGSANTAEGATKTKSQYAYELKTASYKKEATLVGFTDEFSLDFARLQSDILGKARTDLINAINSNVLTRLTAAATAYNTATEFKGGSALASANDYDVLAALAAQADNATFGSISNAAVMSTFKKYRMGVSKADGSGEWIDRPSVLNNLAFVGNPAMGADDIMVGDFKQYNVILRGGLIVRVGYNGTDFAENRFSVVLEQFYFDYISTLRAKAIVKGPDFATVKTALTT